MILSFPGHSELELLSRYPSDSWWYCMFSVLHHLPLLFNFRNYCFVSSKGIVELALLPVDGWFHSILALYETGSELWSVSDWPLYKLLRTQNMVSCIYCSTPGMEVWILWCYLLTLCSLAGSTIAVLITGALLSKRFEIAFLLSRNGNLCPAGSFCSLNESFRIQSSISNVGRTLGLPLLLGCWPFRPVHHAHVNFELHFLQLTFWKNQILPKQNSLFFWYHRSLRIKQGYQPNNAIDSWFHLVDNAFQKDFLPITFGNVFGQASWMWKLR